ncbi:unnamed protein product [Choristocarpus tenellus]
MKKADIVAQVSQRAGLTKIQSEAAINALLETIVESVSAKKKVTFKGFGSFEARDRAGRTGRNPSTGEPLEIAASTLPAFTAAKSFKETVSAGSMDC